MHRARPLLLALLALAPFAPLAADAPPSVEWAPDIDLPEGFVETVVTEGLTGATAMDVAPTAASSSASRPGPPRRQGRQAPPRAVRHAQGGQFLGARAHRRDV